MLKAIVALIISAVELVELWSGSQLGVTEEWVETTLMVLLPILVWLIPNDWLRAQPKWPSPP